jgi:hypothetical protein
MVAKITRPGGKPEGNCNQRMVLFIGEGVLVVLVVSYGFLALLEESENFVGVRFSCGV